MPLFTILSLRTGLSVPPGPPRSLSVSEEDFDGSFFSSPGLLTGPLLDMRRPPTSGGPLHGWMIRRWRYGGAAAQGLQENEVNKRKMHRRNVYSRVPSLVQFLSLPVVNTSVPDGGSRSAVSSALHHVVTQAGVTGCPPYAVAWAHTSWQWPPPAVGGKRKLKNMWPANTKSKKLYKNFLTFWSALSLSLMVYVCFFLFSFIYLFHYVAVSWHPCLFFFPLCLSVTHSPSLSFILSLSSGLELSRTHSQRNFLTNIRSIPPFCARRHLYIKFLYLWSLCGRLV